MTRHRRAFTMMEVSVSALVLAMVSVPLFAVFRASGESVRRVDRRKEARYLLQEFFPEPAHRRLTTMKKTVGGNDNGAEADPRESDLMPESGLRQPLPDPPGSMSALRVSSSSKGRGRK